MRAQQTATETEEIRKLRSEAETFQAEMHKYKDAYEFSPDMLVSIDPKTTQVVDCNHTMYQKLGYAGKEHIIGKSVGELYHPAYQHKFRQALALFKKEGLVENFELALNTCSGEPLHVLLNVIAVRDENNNIIRSRSSWSDVSTLKLAQDTATKAQRERASVEKSLLQSRNELDQSHLFSRVMSELNADGWWDWDLAQPDIYFFSDGLKKLLGYAAADAPNSLSWIYDNTHPDDREASKQMAHRHLTDGAPFRLQTRLRCKDGSYKWFICRGYALKDDSDNYYRVLGTYNDITALKETEASLLRKNEELTQFGYRTSHDLKSPLVAISGLTECILLDLQDGEIDEVAANIEKIKQSSNSLTKLVNDIMELSRADLADEEEQTIDVPTMIKDMDAVLAESTGTHPVQLICSNQITAPFASQPERLWQVLYNLVSNSIKYANTARERSFVDLKFSLSDHSIQIDIRDNGVGIPEKYHARLFERFQRFHPKMAKGSGLGLSIVKSNIDRLGASIHIESSPHGTHYRITFPVKDPAGTPQ